mmetsp:Transcript_81986/g.232418  ORF Transcript_81986/g.232418 Transcript_81986/m.232418 type:complete len:461 (+) Transcript_81986:1384-2766(+)
MAIHVEKKLAARSPRHQHVLHRIDCFMLLHCRVAVAAVQIEADGACSRVTPCDAIGVQHGADLEYKFSPEVRRPRVIGQYELEEAVDGELPRRLPWVHAAGEEAVGAAREPQRRLVIQLPDGSVDAVLSQRSQDGFGHLLAGPVFACSGHILRDGDHVHHPSFGRTGHSLPVVVDALARTAHVVVPVARGEVVHFRVLAARRRSRGGTDVRFVLGARRRRRSRGAGALLEVVQGGVAIGSQLELPEEVLLLGRPVGSAPPCLRPLRHRGHPRRPRLRPALGRKVGVQPVKPSQELAVAVRVAEGEPGLPWRPVELVLPSALPAEHRGLPHLNVGLGRESLPSLLRGSPHPRPVTGRVQVTLLAHAVNNDLDLTHEFLRGRDTKMEPESLGLLEGIAMTIPGYLHAEGRDAVGLGRDGGCGSPGDGALLRLLPLPAAAKCIATVEGGCKLPPTDVPGTLCP